MENHPDRFPTDRKPLQELRIIALNEAYASLMSLPRGPGFAGPARAGSAAGNPPAAGRVRPGSRRPARPPSACTAILRTRITSRGFFSFSLAVHGIAEMDARVAAGRQPSYTPRYEAARDFAGSLGLLAEAHRYFARVIERHPGSVWAADATLKLRRIERFTRLYRKILSNLGAAAR